MNIYYCKRQCRGPHPNRINIFFVAAKAEIFTMTRGVSVEYCPMPTFQNKYGWYWCISISNIFPVNRNSKMNGGYNRTSSALCFCYALILATLQ